MTELDSIVHKQKFDIPADATMADAMACMIENGNGSAVLIEKGIPVGIVTEGLIVEYLKENTNFLSFVRHIAKTPVITACANRPVEFAFDLAVSNNIRRIVVVDNQGFYKGIVLQEDLFNFLEEDAYKVDLKISDIIKRDAMIVSISQDATIADAMDIMHEKNVGSVIVKNSHEIPLGIVTEKDIIKTSYNHIDLYNPINSIMSSPVVTVSLETFVTETIDIMKQRSIRRVLVEDKDGKMITLLTNRDIFRHIKGNLAHMLEIKLRHAKEIMDMLPEAIVEIFDASGYQTIHWMNRCAIDIFGTQMVGQPPENLLGKDIWRDLYKAFDLSNKLKEIKVPIKDKIYEFSGVLSANLNSRYIKLIAIDITEHENDKARLKDEVHKEMQKRMENEYLLMQQSRLASTGGMIGNIAHQWRQPLAQLGGIFMNLEAAYNFKELDGDYLQEKVQSGNKMIKYMSQTIEDFRLFFESNSLEECFDIVEVIERAAAIIEASLSYNHIKLKIDGEKNKFFAFGSSSEFAQAVLNLLNNAKDALIDKNIEFPVIHIEVIKKDNAIVVRVYDNGGGIESDILDKVFDPYVTTKKDKGGAGIGLYISRLIIERKMKGVIEAKNLNGGAAFTIEVSAAPSK